MIKKNKKTPLEEMTEEIKKMGADEFFKRLDMLEESLAAGVFDEKTERKTKDRG